MRPGLAIVLIAFASPAFAQSGLFPDNGSSIYDPKSGETTTITRELGGYRTENLQTGEVNRLTPNPLGGGYITEQVRKPISEWQPAYR